MDSASRRLDSVCLYCGSSNTGDPDFTTAAGELGRGLAAAGVRLVYGGGGVGLMGAAAKAAHEAGGRVLGVMPEFLRSREILYDEVETVVVQSMHERKMIMFQESDAFVVAPGGVGTLEEIVELLSWKRLDLHAKPVIFLNLKGFWEPFYELIHHTIRANFTPPEFADAWISVDSIEEALQVLRPSAATVTL